MWPGRSRTSDSWIRCLTCCRCKCLSCKVYMSCRMSKPTKWPLSAQSDQSLCCPHEETFGPQLPIERTAKTDQTGRMPRLIWVFAGHKGYFIGFVIRLTFRKCIFIFASGLRYTPQFWRPCSLALWLQSQGSLVRAPALPHTGYAFNLRRISHEIMYMVFLLFSLIQERQFLVISESICTLDHFVLVNCIEGLSLSARRVGSLI